MKPHYRLHCRLEYHWGKWWTLWRVLENGVWFGYCPYAILAAAEGNDDWARVDRPVIR